MKLFDLHCDTLSELYRRKESPEENTCHVSFRRAFSRFEEYGQVTAVWSRHSLDGEENFRQFDEIVGYAAPMLVRENFTPILAVEGGKLLCGELRRLDYLRDRGVRILTPVWQGDCCIGGAFDTDHGLTPFGEETIRRCFALGIVPDLSHASDRLFWETAALAKACGGTIMASHSCSRAIFDHPRNLTDDMAKRIAGCGGVIGVSLVTEHLGATTLNKVCEHILHLADTVGEDAVCLGCDFDGTDSLPDGIGGIEDLPKLYAALSESRYSPAFADKVFYTNARNFAMSHLL